MTAPVALTLFTAATLGAETCTDVVFEVEEPGTVLPSGKVYVNGPVAVLFNVWLAGMD
ncbi:hypothetical protein D3C76_1404210 [compost metagenome]